MPSARGPGGSSPSAAIPPPTGGWTSCASAPEQSEVVAVRGGRRYAYRLGIAGRASGAQQPGRARGRRKRWAPTSPGRRARWAICAPPAGRGERRRIAVRGGEALLLDESYNANPASMRAALAVLGQVAGPSHRRARRHAGAGRAAGDLHAALADAVGGGRDRARLHLRPVDGAAARRLAGGAARRPCRATAAALAPAVLEAVRPGDVVLVKGSLGSRMARVVAALRARARRRRAAAHEERV